jgi:hypothetical protein
MSCLRILVADIVQKFQHGDMIEAALPAAEGMD